MDFDRLNEFLIGIATHNNRDWFYAHKEEYDDLRGQFVEFGQEFINRLGVIDGSVAHVQPKDAMYRFNRDTRFSPDKSPYKRHFALFVNANGKKSITGGYYLHVQPGNTMIAVGNYWMPTKILNACRQEICDNRERWKEVVENKEFVKAFGKPGANVVDAFYPDREKGFGMNKLKTVPKGFDKEDELIESLRLKDYCAWHKLPDLTNANADKTIAQALRYCEIGKPMQDIVNPVILAALEEEDD